MKMKKEYFHPFLMLSHANFMISELTNLRAQSDLYTGNLDAMINKCANIKN